MGKRSQRRSTEQDENNVGCVWGLMRMFYFRRDPKFLLDTKQVSGRHMFRETTDRGHSTKNSRDFEEIDEDDNEEITSQKRTVKKLMEDELGKVDISKQTRNNEIQRRLADMGNDVSLDGSSEHIYQSVGALDHHTDILAPYLSVSVDSQGSKSLNRSEEYDLESVLANFLGDIYRCHIACPHDDCKSKNELCPSLKSLIHQKLNDLNSPHCNLDHEQSQESKGEKLQGENSPQNKAVQSKEFKDALEILSSNKELFLNLLQKPNSHILDNIQKHQNNRLTTKLEADNIIGKSNFLGKTGGSNYHELATKAQGKESKHMFFWRKDKSHRKQMPEETNRSQPVSKIVILKPNPGRGIDQAVTNSSSSLHQQPCKSQAPEYSGRESSKFSIKEVRRRFRVVAGESRRERKAIPADNRQRDSSWLKDSAITVKKNYRHLSEGSLVDKDATNFKNETSPSTSGQQKQQNGSQSEFSGHAVASKGLSIFYEEAKKHLTDMLKDNNQTANYPTIQVSKSLEGMLSVPHCNVLSPTSNPREKGCLDLSPEEMEACRVPIVDREKPEQERSQQQGDSDSTEYCIAAVHDKVAILEECSMKEKTQEGSIYVTDEACTMCIEETEKLDCSKTFCNAPAERCRDSSQTEMLEETEGKEPVEMFMGSPDSMVQKVEQQDPKTPESRASTKLEKSNEKQEQPSPVSVLDLFDEDVSFSECENMKEDDLHEEFRGTLYFPDNDSGIKVFWEDKIIRSDYIKLVLELSELCAEQNLEVWYLEDELISPCLIEELPNQGDQIDDLKLLFDCICKALTEIQERYFRLSSWLSFLKHDIRTPPIGENLISEVDRYIDRYLQHSLPSTLDQIIKRDLEVQPWMDIRSKTEGIIAEIWEFVLDELIDEAVFDLWI